MGNCPLPPWFEAARAAGSMRVIISSDVANEADDPFAIAHALLTPAFDVRGIIAAHYGEAGSSARSAELAHDLLRSMPGVSVPVMEGCPVPLDGLVGGSAAETVTVRRLIEEALADDGRPLYVLALGSLTDVACALRVEPAIASRMTVVWVGGGRYPQGSHEANLARDLTAAREVFASPVELWQIPSGAYKQLVVSVAELELRLSAAGPLGAMLLGHMKRFAADAMDSKRWIMPESWVLGDQAAVGVLLAEMKGCYRNIPAPSLRDDCRYGAPAEGVGARTVRVYDAVDTRFILEDLFAKLMLYSARMGM